MSSLSHENREKINVAYFLLHIKQAVAGVYTFIYILPKWRFKMMPMNEVSQYLAGTRILLIDDSEPFQHLTSQMLRKSGVHNVVVASTLAEGMRLMNFNRGDKSGAAEFDLVMMDINLPDGNGIEGCKFISSHAATYNIPVVVISGDFKPLTVGKAFEAGASDYLHKPLVAELLKMHLGLLLKLRNMEQQYSRFNFNSLSFCR